TPSPSPSPTSTQAVEYQLERVSLPGGVGSQQLLGRTSPRQIKRYLINVKKGQNLSVQVPQSVDASVDVRFPDDKLIPDASGAKYWQKQVSRDGDYKIDVIASKRTDFELNVNVSE
ncbi:MAG: serine/threonine protein kinase, partial [Coleofasciculaceae cyanobacterium]